VIADGTTIKFTPPPDGPPPVVLPQDRVFSREYEARLRAKVSAEFFRRLLAGRGFGAVEQRHLHCTPEVTNAGRADWTRAAGKHR
jgi:hypothetical protein